MQNSEFPSAAPRFAVVAVPPSQAFAPLREASSDAVVRLDKRDREFLRQSLENRTCKPTVQTAMLQFGEAGTTTAE